MIAAWRIFSIVLGCVLLAVTLSPAFDALSEASFTWHMAQHIVLMLIVPPLVLLGRPLLYAVRLLPPPAARRIVHAVHAWPLAWLTSPVTAWLLFVSVLWISHFSPLYNTALEHPLVHIFEHALYLGAAFLFWSHVIGTGLDAHPLSFPARMLYIFLAVPQGAFLGVALLQTKYALYPHYQYVESSAAALKDQHNSGALMWIAGGLLLFAAFMLCMGAWAACERAASHDTRARA